MSGASIEQTLDLWSAELRAVKAQLQPLFGHASVAASAAAFLDGLLGPERRKTGWMRAEAAGDPGPWRQQAVLGRSVGMPTRYATWCATMPSRPWQHRMRCW
jgi:SRSO17 transposase